MLVATPSAVSHLLATAQQMGLDHRVGVRVYGKERPGGRPAVGVGFAAEPSDGDEVSHQFGTRLFVAPEVAPAVSGAVLDVRESADGAKLVLVHTGDTGSS